MRWLGRTALIMLAIVAVLAPALWIGRDVVPPRLARWAINRAAGAEIVDELAFRIAGLSTGHLTLSDLRVNADQALSADTLRLDFTPRELLDGRLRQVTVTGPELSVSLAPDGRVSLGSLDLAVLILGDGAGGSAEAPPLDRLELRDVHIRLSGAAAGWLDLDGTVTPRAEGLTADVEWRAEVEAVDLAAGFSAAGRATVERRAGTTHSTVTLDQGRVAGGNLDLENLGGTVALHLPADGLPDVTAALTAARLAAGDTVLEAPSLHLHYGADGASVVARLGPQDSPEIEVAAVADTPGDDGRGPVRVEGRADLRRLDALLAAALDQPVLDLRGALRADLAGTAPLEDLDPVELWRETVASGGLMVALDDGRLPPPASGRAHGTARFALALAAGRLSVETAGPAVLDAELAAAAPGTAGTPLGEGPARLALGTDTTSFRLLLAEPFGTATVEIAGPAQLTTGDGASAELDGSVSFRRPGEGWTLHQVPTATLRVAGLRRNGVALERAEATLVEVGPSRYGPVGLFALSLEASVPDRGISGAAVTATGRITADSGGMHAVLSAPARLSIDRLAPAAPLAPIERFTAQLAASEQPVLTLPGDGGPAAFRLDMELPALAVASARPNAWRIDLDPMRIGAEGHLGETDGEMRIRFNRGKAEIAPAGVVLQGLAADLRLALEPAGVRLDRLDIDARRISDQARLARFVPLSLDGSAEAAGTVAEPDRLAFRATLRGSDGAFVLDATGRHSPTSGRGEARLKLFPIRFVPGGLQPADLSPAASSLFRGTSGEVSLGGRVRWPGEAVPPNDPLTLTLTDLGFTGSLGTVTGLGGAIALTRVDPPATPAGQELSAKAIDLGIPLVEPRIRFRLESERLLRLELVEAGFANGRVHAENVAVRLGGDEPVPVVLAVENVDAARLAEATDLDGLAATGTLSGRLPLLWDPAVGLTIEDAHLSAASGGGTLRYVPDESAPALQDAGEQVSLLLRAVRNFVYESLEVEVDGRPGEPFDVKLRLRGANPDLYDGYPIALNVTLTGALDQVFSNLRRSLGLTDVVRRRLEASGGG